jgi:hypothetical protein
LPQPNAIPDILGPEPARELQPQQPQPFCNICQESVQIEQSIRILNCLHVFCTECIQGHVRAQLAQNLFPIHCPDCAADLSNREHTSKLFASSIASWVIAMFIPDISFAQVERMLTDAEKERWWTLEIAPFAVDVRCPRYVLPLPLFVLTLTVRRCDRSALLDREEYSRVGTLNCPLPGCCGTRFCKFCMNILTDLSHHTCDGSAEFDRLVAQRDWKRCPGRTFYVTSMIGRHFSLSSQTQLAGRLLNMMVDAFT